MKKQLLLCILLGLCATTFGQTKSIFTQASTLYSKRKTGIKKPTFIIDQKMAIDMQNLFAGGDMNSISNAMNTNPFIKGVIIFTTAAAAGKPDDVVNSTLSSLSSLDVTNFANAIASVMIDRAKQELTLAFFNRLTDFSKKYPEFQTLFPTTYDKLRNLLSYNYPQMLPTLRDAFFADIQNVTFNLEAVLELPKYAILRDNFPEINIAIQTLRTVHKLEQGETPDSIIVDVDTAVTMITRGDYYINASRDVKNVVATVHFATLFSESLRNVDKLHIWITADEAKKLVNDSLFTRIYLALLWQEVNIRPVKINYYLDEKNPDAATPLTDLLANNVNNVMLFQNKIAQFLSVTAKVESAYTEIHAIPHNEKITPEQYYNYINTSLDAIDFTLSLVKIVDRRLQDDNYLAIARKANGLYKDVYSKQYTQAMSDGIDIITSVANLTHTPLKIGSAAATQKTKKDRKAEDKKKTEDQKKTDADKKDKEDDLALSIKDTSDKLLTFINKAKPLILFIGTVADAKSSSDIQAALNNAILPVGSSSIKKNTHYNLCLQTYLGAYCSVYNQEPDAIRAWTDKVGVYGPIGLAYTPGFLSWGKSGSLSIFGSLFDLGAIIDYKLKQDTTTKTSTNTATNSTSSKQYAVNLGQLFSPGIHLVYGLFSNIPVSLGFGMQYGPGLSSINASGTTNVINPSWRANLFLAVDLPFINLINKRR